MAMALHQRTRRSGSSPVRTASRLPYVDRALTTPGRHLFWLRQAPRARGTRARGLRDSDRAGAGGLPARARRRGTRATAYRRAGRNGAGGEHPREGGRRGARVGPRGRAREQRGERAEGPARGGRVRWCAFDGTERC